MAPLPIEIGSSTTIIPPPLNVRVLFDPVIDPEELMVNNAPV